MEPKRVTLFCGHYGSGKTNAAVNYALWLKSRGYPAALADIDVVNPYFRSRDSEEALRAAGIDVVSLPFANSNVDLPALPSAVYGLVQRRDVYAVLDVGGDDRGALALGRFAPYILAENDFDMLGVVNFYRPLTETPEDAMEALREIAAATSIPFTGLVNNSNLGRETTPEAVAATFGKAKALSELSGLPVKFVSVRRDIADALSDRGETVFPMDLQPNAYGI